MTLGVGSVPAPLVAADATVEPDTVAGTGDVPSLDIDGAVVRVLRSWALPELEEAVWPL